MEAVPLTVPIAAEHLGTTVSWILAQLDAGTIQAACRSADESTFQAFAPRHVGVARFQALLSSREVLITQTSRLRGFPATTQRWLPTLTADVEFLPNETVYGDATSRTVDLTIDDIYLLPAALAVLADRLRSKADTGAARSSDTETPRHETELLKCIGALAKLLAEHAPTTKGFTAKRKGHPYNATKIGEAVERECGLNSSTVAGWLGEAKKVLAADPDAT